MTVFIQTIVIIAYILSILNCKVWKTMFEIKSVELGDKLVWQVDFSSPNHMFLMAGVTQNCHTLPIALNLLTTEVG